MDVTNTHVDANRHVEVSSFKSTTDEMDSSHKGGRVASHPIEFKLKVVDPSQITSNYAAAKMDSSHKGRRVASHPIEFKLKVVEHSKLTSNNAAAKLFSVDRKRVREWRKKEEQLREVNNKSPNGRKRLTGGGRLLQYPDIEMQLLAFVEERRGQNSGTVTGVALQEEASRLHALHGDQSFKASAGWLTRFAKRHKVSVSFRTYRREINAKVKVSKPWLAT